MAETFNRYAKHYDLIYDDKDYKSECDFIDLVLTRYSSKSAKSILEIGCGTGGHAIPLSRRGYRMTGIDLSEDMISMGKSKAISENLNVELLNGDVRDFQINKKFDACISMFSVLGYLTKTEDILKAFRNIRSHLDTGAIFLFDVWNGLAVLRILPEPRVKKIKRDNIKLVRTVEPTLDAVHHICWTNYKVVVTENDKIVDKFEEKHFSRFFFPQEIKFYLESSGFEVLSICPFLHLDSILDENEWNMAIIAKTQ